MVAGKIEVLIALKKCFGQEPVTGAVKGRVYQIRTDVGLVASGRNSSVLGCK